MRITLAQFAAAGFLAVVCLGHAAGNARAENTETVEYRLTEWKTQHFHDAGKADTHAETLKKLGCEVKRDSHDGHIDVSYRCPEWRRMSLKTHEEAHRWEKWLKAVGFQTRHEH